MQDAHLAVGHVRVEHAGAGSTGLVEHDLPVGPDDLRHEHRVVVDPVTGDRRRDVRHLERRDGDDAEREREHLPLVHGLTTGHVRPHAELLRHVDDLVDADAGRQTHEGAVHGLGRGLIHVHDAALALAAGVGREPFDAGHAAGRIAVDLVVARVAVRQDRGQRRDLEARTHLPAGAVRGEVELGLAERPAVGHRLHVAGLRVHRDERAGEARLGERQPTRHGAVGHLLQVRVLGRVHLEPALQDFVAPLLRRCAEPRVGQQDFLGLLGPRVVGPQLR